MRVEDFGHFDGPLVLFGGVYSNQQAFEALLEVEKGREFISTGDIVGYCADPMNVVAMYMVEDFWGGIAGNCETQVASGADDCGCGFEDGTACDLLSRGWYPYLQSEMTEDAVASLAGLPDIGLVTQQGKRYAVIHGGATANNRFLWPSSDEADFRHEIEALEARLGSIDGVIAGHSGIAFNRVIGRHHWINPGAVGLPPHDGRPETRYAVLEAGDVIIHRLAYDHEAARARMEAVGLTQGYHETLTTGIWPSEDVLPEELRR